MKYLYKYLLIALILIGFSACDTFLEPIDDNHLTEERGFVDPAFAEAILLNGYTNLIDQYSFTGAATDDAVNNDFGSGFSRMAQGEWSANFNPVNRWSKIETVLYINKFILLIEQVEWKRDQTINELFKKRLLGEALALRAIHHFYVLQTHAGKGASSGNLLGIPYFKEFIDSDGDFNIPRLTFQESVSEIMSDFNAAMNLLPMDFSDNPEDMPSSYESYGFDAYQVVFGSSSNFRVTGRIITAFKAKLSLLAASPAFLNGSGNSYQDAVTYAVELLKDIGGIAGLDPNGGEFYNEDGDKNLSEILWRGSTFISSSVEEDQLPPSLNGKGRVNPSRNLVDAFPMKNGLPISEDSSYDPQDPYANRDPRLGKYILYNGNTIGENTIFTGVGAGVDRLDSIAQKSTRTGYYLKKMLRPDVRINNDGSKVEKEHFNVFLRYTELFLIFAEAANEIGGPDYNGTAGFSAREVIAAIRQRAGIDADDSYLQSISTKEEMRELIRNERRLELCFEGYRFWDLRRWDVNLGESVDGSFFNGQSYSTLSGVEPRNYGQNAIYGPIPHSEIVKFSNLEQNEGW